MVNLRKIILIGSAVIISSVGLATSPKMYDYGVHLNNTMTEWKTYNSHEDISQLTHEPAAAVKKYDFTDKDLQPVKALYGGDFDVEITPVALVGQEEDYFLELRIRNNSEQHLVGSFKARGYLKKDPPGCPVITRSQEYKIPKGEEFTIYVPGEKLEKDWLWNQDGKIRFKLDSHLETEKESGFREVVLELPASKNLEELITF